jgi:hypothetical protein
MSTLEFFDYIFDRYAYLGVDPQSSVEEIASMIRQRRAAIHPDKLLRVSADILSAARRERDVVDDCARMLLDPAMRELYDVKLNEFKLSEPHLVSEDGVARFDPARFRIDLDFLMGDREQDIEGVKNQARAMSGMDEKRIEKARKRFAAHPLDLDARDALRDELTKKVVCLAALEDFLWQAAGVNGALEGDDHSRAQSGEHFQNEALEKLERFKNQAEKIVAAREGMAQLGLAPRLLLAGPAGSTAAGASLSELAARVGEALEERSQALRQAVAEKSKAIDELAKVSRWAWVGQERHSRLLDIVMVRSEADYDEAWPGPDFVAQGFLIRLDRETGEATPIIQSPCAQELAQWPHAVVTLESNPEIPGLFIEAFALANLLGEPGEEKPAH